MIDLKLLFFDIETTGLNPFEDRISLISISDGEKIRDIPARDESRAILEFIMSTWGTVLVGYNIKSFDLPFITTRAVINRIPPNVIAQLHAAYKIDLMNVVRRYMLVNNYNKHSLTYVHSVITGEQPDDCSGAEAAALGKKYLDGDNTALDKIRYHCHCDILRLQDLFDYLRDLIQLYFRRKYGFDAYFVTGWMRDGGLLDELYSGCDIEKSD